MNSRLTEFLEENNIIVDEQNGFRKQRSCIDHIFTLSCIVNNRIIKNKNTFAAFIDMSKAFDSVNREFLFYKLLLNNINGKFYNAIKALYNDTLSAVQINQYLTDWFITESGVRQGDNLSPTLFALYLNDLAIELNRKKLGINIDGLHICILLYADDIVIVSENEDNLQKMLTYVHEWCCKWDMKVNVEKTKIIHFRKKRKKITDIVFTIGKDKIDIVSSYKYLGVIFDENLTFKECSENLCASAGRALSSIISKFQPLKYGAAGHRTFTTLYNTGVKSILEYGSEIWGYQHDKVGQRVQYRAIRYFLGVHKTAPLLGLESEMGWLNLKYYYHLSILRFWNRLMKMNQSRLTRRIFEWDFKNINDNNWSGKVLLISEKLGLSKTVVSGEVFDLQKAKEIFKDIMHNEWSNNIGGMPKLRYYSHFKCDIETETYLTVNLTRYQRSLIAQLRLGILPLSIETGRYFRTPIEKRLCKICNQGVIEDTIHFLCECVEYRRERQNLLNSTKTNLDRYMLLSPIEKLVYVMSIKPRNLALYVETIWNIRKRISEE